MSDQCHVQAPAEQPIREGEKIGCAPIPEVIACTNVYHDPEWILGEGRGVCGCRGGNARVKRYGAVRDSEMLQQADLVGNGVPRAPGRVAGSQQGIRPIAVRGPVTDAMTDPADACEECTVGTGMEVHGHSAAHSQYLTAEIQHIGGSGFPVHGQDMMDPGKKAHKVNKGGLGHVGQTYMRKVAGKQLNCRQGEYDVPQETRAQKQHTIAHIMRGKYAGADHSPSIRASSGSMTGMPSRTG